MQLYINTLSVSYFKWLFLMKMYSTLPFHLVLEIANNIPFFLLCKFFIALVNASIVFHENFSNKILCNECKHSYRKASLHFVKRFKLNEKNASLRLVDIPKLYFTHVGFPHLDWRIAKYWTKNITLQFVTFYYYFVFGLQCRNSWLGFREFILK